MRRWSGVIAVAFGVCPRRSCRSWRTQFSIEVLLTPIASHATLTEKPRTTTRPAASNRNSGLNVFLFFAILSPNNKNRKKKHPETGGQIDYATTILIAGE